MILIYHDLIQLKDTKPFGLISIKLNHSNRFSVFGSNFKTAKMVKWFIPMRIRIIIGIYWSSVNHRTFKIFKCFSLNISQLKNNLYHQFSENMAISLWKSVEILWMCLNISTNANHHWICCWKCCLGCRPDITPFHPHQNRTIPKLLLRYFLNKLIPKIN